jgi:hypothetical protein
MAEVAIIVSPHIKPDDQKHSNAFDVRFRGELICTSETPFLDGARELLKRGMAEPDDMLTMWHEGSEHWAIRARVGMAAKLVRREPKGKGRLRLVKALDLTTVWPRIALNGSEAAK